MRPLFVPFLALLCVLAAVPASAGQRHLGAGNHHSVFYLADQNTLYTAGENELGQLGLGPAAPAWRTHAVAERLEPFWTGRLVDVAAGLNTSIVVDEAGAVFTWGYNVQKQLGYDGVGRIGPTPSYPSCFWTL
jgi:alpha-tubulin suppressor-like RCC1 family protein